MKGCVDGGLVNRCVNGVDTRGGVNVGHVKGFDEG